jgi:sigma-B regulation protein RsbU (phosphoserine phosphatase)
VYTRILQQEIKRLKKEKAVYQAQSRMLDHFVSVARASADQKMINVTLQKTLEVSIGLTDAEKGSLFLLDENGVVIESILTRAQASSDERNRLIGTVLDQGLAGWVRRHCNIKNGNCKLAYICDTQKDDRWLTLPGQPYEVRSALVVPIIRKERLLGLLTLLHSRPGHFGTESIELIEMTAVQIGVVLENATLYAKLEESFHRIAQAKKEIEIYSGALDLEMEKGRKIQRDFLPEQIPSAPGHSGFRRFLRRIRVVQPSPRPGCGRCLRQGDRCGSFHGAFSQPHPRLHLGGRDIGWIVGPGSRSRRLRRP